MTQYGLDVDDLVAAEYPELSFLLAPWLALPSLAILWAWRGVGKSWVALSIAHACAIGGSFLGWKAPRAMRVCLIDGELGRKYLSERICKVDRSAEANVIGHNLRIVTFEDAPNNAIWNLADPRQQPIYSEIVEDYDLIIVDNIATTVRLAGRGLANDVETWASVQTWAIAQRSKGKSILFIDHAGKGGSQRGTSTKEDVMDTIISLTRDLDYEPSYGAEFNWKFEKSRHFFGDVAQSLRVALKDTADGRLTWDWRPLRTHIEERCTALLRKGRPINAIISALNISRNRIEEIREKIKEEQSYGEPFDPRNPERESREGPF